MKKEEILLEAEKAVIGSCLIEPVKVMFVCNEHGLSIDHFTDWRLGAIYSAIKTIATKRGPEHIDSISVMSGIEGKGISLEDVEEIINGVTAPAHIYYYLEIIMDSYDARCITEVMCQAIEDVKVRKPSEVIVDMMCEISGSMNRRETASPEEVNKEVVNGWIRSKEHGSMGYPSRWMPLENILGSYVPKEMVLLAGRPSEGKTTLAINEVINLASNHGVPCAIASVEMDEGALRARMAGEICGVSTFKMRRGLYSDNDLSKMQAALETIASLPIYINDKINNIGSLQSWLTNITLTKGVKFFVLDYLQLLQDNRSGNQTTNDVVAFWSSTIKSLQKRLGLAGLVLSQLSRSGNRNQSVAPAGPTLEALRSSGSLEQDADVVIFVYKKPNTPVEMFSLDQDWNMDIEVAKHRGGPTGVIPMVFRRSKQLFVTSHEYNAIQFDERRAEINS